MPGGPRVLGKPITRFQVLILFILLACSLAGAVAGGGGDYVPSFDGGGSSGGGSSWDWGSGSGGGGSFEPVSSLVFILIFVVIYMIKANSGTGKDEFKFDTSPNPDLNPSWRLKSVPGSTVTEELKLKLDTVFVAIQKAWSDGSMDPARAVLSDGVYHRFQLQLRMNAAQGIRNTVADPVLLNATLVQERVFGRYHSADFLMEGSAVDSTLKVDTGELLRGGNLIRFNELWSFTRLANIPGEALKSLANCPKCGAALSNSGGTHCSHCSALLNSGELDWVLAEITQPIEWRAQGESPLRKFYDQLPDLSGVDAAAWLSPQELEDRASVVFIRYQTALQDGSFTSLIPFATPEVRSAMKARGGRPLFRLAVGAVELLRFQVVQDQVKAFIRVKYSGSELPDILGTNRERFLAFSKALTAGVGKACLSSLSCPNCAAPVGTSDQARCAYCAVDLASPDTGWTLCDYGGPEVLSPAFGEPQKVDDSVGRDRAFHALAVLAKADPTLARTAVPVLHAFGLQKGMKLGELASILDRPDEGTGGRPIDLDAQEARSFYRDLDAWSHRTPMHRPIAMSLARAFASQYGVVESGMRQVTQVHRLLE